MISTNVDRYFQISSVTALDVSNAEMNFATDYTFLGNHIVLQPTTLCNLNCSYCYLPERELHQLMPLQVARRVAEHVRESEQPVALIWHGGEPLSCGTQHFRALLSEFEFGLSSQRVLHYVQTNGTLITRPWCDLFKEFRVKVGVSIDGPAHLNLCRNDWSGRPSATLCLRGLSLLRQEGISFGLLAVASRMTLSYARALYDFAVAQDCQYLGLNIEETEGVNRAESFHFCEVTRFWEDLYHAWRDNPVIEVREISRALLHMQQIANGDISFYSSRTLDLLPTISWTGDVTLLAPEFLNTGPQFVVGNLMQHKLGDLLSKVRESRYVKDFLVGLEGCRAHCQYFDFCGGGSASNRYFEHRTLRAFETEACNNRTKALVNALLNALTEEAQ